MTKKVWKRLIGISLVLIIIILLLLNKEGLLSKRDERSGFDSGRQNAILPVKAMIVKTAPLEDKVIASGTIMADEQVEISAEASGRILNIHFSEGKFVNAGDLLVTINNADLQAQIERNGFQLRLAEEREQRQLALLERQGISQQTYDQVLTELNALKAEASLLKANLDKTLIRAPFSGVLGLRYLSEGSYVSPGTKIIRLARIQPIKVEFNVPERFVSYVKKGVSIRFSVENLSDIFSATLYAVEPVVDQTTRSIAARAIYDNKDGLIIPGSFARVELPLENLVEAIQVQSQALIPEMGSNKVFVYRNGVAQPMKVGTGLRTESHIQITSGLQVGDTVITTGLLQLRPGMSVKLTQID
ncbi:MAG: efflux transporter periplasmic adaptor subunit [Bacteroidetes bacterium HGW-Bacteroidetes-1]|jgi:membrane fusion protein (multidrug efflux system)|nr:MAG: efflux transporter periplasmic adaptor subunit [Bacteroidetes bacterium HGW-Bacteroidetes-1]